MMLNTLEQQFCYAWTYSFAGCNETHKYMKEMTTFTKMRSLQVKVLASRMSDRISDLPDEILCIMLSFLTLRDSVRTRLLSARWRYLSDWRSVLLFDDVNVFGSEKPCREPYISKFVSAVDQFLESWQGRNLSAVKMRLCLGNEHILHINWWVKTVVRMEVEDLDLKFLTAFKPYEGYKLDTGLFCSGEEIYLKHLHLTRCTLQFSSRCMRWISQLATLELTHVSLDQKELDYILSKGLNITSLKLDRCCEQRVNRIIIKLPCLKKLRIWANLEGIEISCPKLEMLHYVGRASNFKFSHVPLLREVVLELFYHLGGCSLVCNGLAKAAPTLQKLDLTVTTEVQPLPANNVLSCLKQLDLVTEVPTGFDLLSITYFLKASPFLETLHLKLRWRSFTRESPQREYPDWPHLALKEVRVEEYRANGLDLGATGALVRYLLKIAVALERMIILVDSYWTPEALEKLPTTLLQDTTTDKLVIQKVDHCFTRTF